MKLCRTYMFLGFFLFVLFCFALFVLVWFDFISFYFAYLHLFRDFFGLLCLLSFQLQFSSGNSLFLSCITELVNHEVVSVLFYSCLFFQVNGHFPWNNKQEEHNMIFITERMSDTNQLSEAVQKHCLRYSVFIVKRYTSVERAEAATLEKFKRK